jgi:transaldolase/glucose-6-phosphate isomerase
MNPLQELRKAGQSPWYDSLSRPLILSGELSRLISDDGLCGVTSNPTIFEKAIGADYQPAIRQAASDAMGVKAVYERLVVRDIQDAADLLLSVYRKSNATDGFVSLEVSPALACDTEGSVAEALRLHGACGRDNVMIKIPATAEGIVAIERLVARGVSVNVTLLFDVAVYEQVAWAYVAGLEQAQSAGYPIDKIASVASFFVSRIDTVVDQKLMERTRDDAGLRPLAERLAGKIAIANAKRAYRTFRSVVESPRYLALQKIGAQPQRLLWASTGTKNPAYPDTYYVEALIGPDTVNTLPAATMAAFRDHGKVAPTLLSGADEAEELLRQLAGMGIDLAEIARGLVTDGVRLFDTSFRQLIRTIARARREYLQLPALSERLGPLQSAVSERMTRLSDFPAFWRKATEGLATGIGWLTLPETANRSDLQKWADGARAFRHLLVIGMGGSALGVEAIRQTFTRTVEAVGGHPTLHLLDHPIEIEEVCSKIDLAKTLLVVSSKSGTTFETRLMFDYFFDRLQPLPFAERGALFVVITDPESPLWQVAEARNVRAILPGAPDVGGRYSVLSNFGLAPAAMIGVDVATLLDGAGRMRQSCAADLPADENPAARLGAALAEAERSGRNKVTFFLSSELVGLGTWLEQLLSESLGKKGRGIIPIINEPIGTPEVYGADRFFIQIRARGEADLLHPLEQAGYPTVQIDTAGAGDLGAMFYLWEMATATAGLLLGINPFDQPDVEEAKEQTRQILSSYVPGSPLPKDEAEQILDGIALYGNRAKSASDLRGVIAAQLADLKPGDYFALTAYLEGKYQERLQAIRLQIRNRFRCATMLQFGPRYLHSTGQVYRGGPNTGVFFQITAHDPAPVEIPERPYTFGVATMAQAVGDFESLKQRGRRILRLHIGSDIAGGLTRLEEAVAWATQS